ncbi:hypothetical protein AMECASPLE_008682 [Ameca splendens]|uniref:Uncharacterized protein n=1 Tax=Ameca splendens TaxID=208324 RepID=A0ABV0ZJQ5_9TELE
MPECFAHMSETGFLRWCLSSGLQSSASWFPASVWTPSNWIPLLLSATPLSVLLLTYIRLLTSASTPVTSLSTLQCVITHQLSSGRK